MEHQKWTGMAILQLSAASLSENWQPQHQSLWYIFTNFHDPLQIPTRLSLAKFWIQHVNLSTKNLRAALENLLKEIFGFINMALYGAILKNQTFLCLFVCMCYVRFKTFIFTI